MSTALRIVHGNFGRVALLDMDCSLVRHAHPHCHVLLKVEGADTQFVVGNRIHPLTDSVAVLVDGWQPHSYVHDPARPRTLILALYVEPEWLKAFRPGWAASGAPGFFENSPWRGIAGHPNTHDGSRVRDDGGSRMPGRIRSVVVGIDDRRDRALHALEELSEIDPRIERVGMRSADQTRGGLHPPQRRRRSRHRYVGERSRSVARAFLPAVPVVDRLAAEGLSQCGSYGAGDGSRASSRFSRRGNWHAPWVFRPRPFHALLPQQRRRFAERVPASLAPRGLKCCTATSRMRRIGRSRECRVWPFLRFAENNLATRRQGVIGRTFFGCRTRPAQP